MARKRGRPRTSDESLSRQRILETALRLVDAHGIEALNMRGLAAELGVDPMAIYHHVPGGKDALLSGLVELVFADLRAPQIEDATWEEQVLACAHAYYEVVRAHPYLIWYITGNVALVEQAFFSANNEQLYAALFKAGLDASEVLHAASLIVDYLHGYSLGDIQPADQNAWAHLEQAVSDEFPLTRRVLAAAQPQAPSFDYGLSIILMGIKALVQKT
jgi:TetR/AcrR family tetracycline transcriptional repressor